MRTVTDEISDVRTYPVSNKVSFEPVSDGLLVRAIFLKPESKDHKVTSSKPVLVSMLFRRLPSLWGRPRETSEG